NLLHDITQLSSRILCVATYNRIIQLDIQTIEITKIQKHARKPHSLSDNNLRSFLRDGDGNIWICNTRYIDVYNIQQGQFKRLEYAQKANKSSIHLNDLPSLYLDKKNTLWLGYEQGLARYDRSTESFVDFEFKQSKAITSATRTICEDHAGNLWIGSYSGLYILSADRQELKHVVH